jgi:mannose/fructose-specific phosphotransferase system component IIA
MPEGESTGPGATRLCGVVVAHGELAEGLLSGLRRVAGAQDNLWAVSNDGLGRDELLARVRSAVEEHAAGRDVVLFSDIGGGSCGQACRKLLADRVVRAVFYGVSLPLLVEFVFLQDQPFDTMVAAMLSKSRNAIGVDR